MARIALRSIRATLDSQPESIMKIKAAVIRKIGLPQPYAKSQPLAIEQAELAQPGERELLVQVQAAGLCR
jgi:Zn-dependent alcohol dehydrogenase